MSLSPDYLRDDLRPRSSAVVWCLTDSKPGHESQLRGLVRALERRRSVDVHWLSAPSRLQNWHDWLRGRSSLGHSLQSPQLIIAAGHRTHAASLAVRRALGGRIVLLMKPTLPTRWFDLCLIPLHDVHANWRVPIRENVITTCGVLNSIRPSCETNVTHGLVLIGGPSKHHGWDDQVICEQIREIVKSSKEMIWRLTTSRRTPATFIPQLQRSPLQNLEVFPVSETPAGWMSQQLTKSRTVFVSEDSVSMVYEALSANVDVGLLRVPRRRTSRVVRGIDHLAELKHVIPFDQWRADRFTSREPCVLQEADRCAEIVCSRLLDAA